MVGDPAACRLWDPTLPGATPTDCQSEHAQFGAHSSQQTALLLCLVSGRGQWVGLRINMFHSVKTTGASRILAALTRLVHSIIIIEDNFRGVKVFMICRNTAQK